MSISAFIPTYNEEKRIETALKTLQWCDEIVLLDKQSNDRTRELAQGLGAKVFVMPNSSAYSASEFNFITSECNSDWVIMFTASDVIHPELAQEIKKLTSDDSFNYDVINVPFRRYILGIETKRSPWYSSHAALVFRKSVMSINKTGVHDALQLNSNRRYSIKNSDTICMYHLTHATVDGMMERHIRYCRGEATASEKESMGRAFLIVLRSIFTTVFVRRSFLLGWKGVMLSCAYISYFMMAFVYKWEKKNSVAKSTYETIQSDILKEWEKKN